MAFKTNFTKQSTFPFIHDTMHTKNSKCTCSGSTVDRLLRPTRLPQICPRNQPLFRPHRRSSNARPHTALTSTPASVIAALLSKATSARPLLERPPCCFEVLAWFEHAGGALLCYPPPKFVKARTESSSVVVQKLERQLSFLSKKVSKAELFQKRGKTRK